MLSNKILQKTVLVSGLNWWCILIPVGCVIWCVVLSQLSVRKVTTNINTQTGCTHASTVMWSIII